MKYLALFIFAASLAFAYSMPPDEIIIDGRIAHALGSPLATYPWKGEHPKLSEHPLEGASDSREIKAIWEIKEGRLYLIAASAYRFGDFAPRRSLGLQDLMPERVRDGKVLADWFSGDLDVFESERPAPSILPNAKNRTEIRIVKRHFKILNGVAEETR